MLVHRADVFARAALRPVTTGALQQRLHREHSQLAPKRFRGLQTEFADLLWRRVLKGALFDMSRVVDTNVNFQEPYGCEKLIELRKRIGKSPYPVEDHGFDREAIGDEYKRIYKLFNGT